MTRRMRVLAAAALATTLMISSGCGSDEDSGPGKNGKAPDKVTYLTGFGTGGHDAFAWVAKEKGFFTEAGLDVAVSLGAPATNNQGLLSGKAQFTYSDVTQLMIQTGNNQVTEMRVIAAVHQSTLVAIFAPEGSGITRPKDLEGKRVGVAQGSITKTLLPAYGKLAGFDASRLQFVESQPQGLVSLLASKKVDVLSTFVITRNTVQTVTKQTMVVLPLTDYLRDLLGTGITTTAGYAKDNPDIVKRFRDAALKGLQYTVEHPEEAAKIMKANNPAVNEQGAAAEIKLMTPYVTSAPGNVVGALDEQRAARAIAVLQGAGLIPGGLTPEKVIDFTIAPKA
ncbi:ABC transporter substrate-binding protein [Plantactinospora soyae]|uniref:NitT/TauT family transport system substrate-binding protein n=1 Tax=Plantactinospora soyae TaxID=1544732 RepID=A0A927QUY5_9ACTN|nr:ABC transporter substrate-binding protein [Plantactinospora soyae]MBE1485100.1 NitT/TauT family transport system substrate-binding protein [Plantactinospora soyae]